MKRRWVTSAAALAAILVLSACSLIQEVPSAGEVVELGVRIDGKLAADVIADPKATDEVLEGLLGKDFTGDEGRERIKALLDRLDKNESLDEEVFQGVCGLSTSEFLRGVVDPSLRRETTGLIGDYLVEFDDNREVNEEKTAYVGRWPGHLTVDTITKVYRKTATGETLLPDRTVYLQWHIRVVKDEKHDGFEVRLRQKKIKDPFPETVVFPDEALDPENEISLWHPDRDLDHKLWAKGTEIVVEEVYQRIGKDGELVLLPKTHEYYKRCEEACIDMMTRGFPPTFRIEFPEQSGYCLGRCDQPHIMNSM